MCAHLVEWLDIGAAEGLGSPWASLNGILVPQSWD